VGGVCGIAGWIAWDRDLSRELGVVAAMNETLARRGPDGAGLWVEGPVALGHRRLVVIDPEGGAQPMVYRLDGTPYVITYNGELYNTPELRAELEDLGHVFRTRSDTEVLLHAYVAFGPEAVERLDGIFAFAVWDGREGRVFLARDRLGVKPLFYATPRPGWLLFASEIKALLAHPAVPAEVDREGLAEVFGLGPARTPGHGVFRGVRELRAGWRAVFDRRGLRLAPYWRLRSRPHRHGAAETAARVRSLLEGAVERQLVSDVPVASLLSGGVDSSAVTAIAARRWSEEGRGPLRTFSVDFVGLDRDFEATPYYADTDAPWVARMAAWLGTDHRRVVLDTAEQVDALEAAVAARDLPGMADIDASLLLFCREIKRGATVALSGEGADEIFGGYPWCHWEDAVAAETFPWSRSVADRARILAPDLRAALDLEGYVANRYAEALAEVPHLPGEAPRDRRLREILYLNVTRFLGTLLDRKDRMSMASGLEVRVPFCDHHLVEYVWNIPWEMKNLHGQPKGILRRALAGLLPPDVLARRKTPYPKTASPGYLRAVQELLLAVLEAPDSPLAPLLDLARVRELARSGAPDVHWFGQTMSGPQFLAYLVQVDAWLRRYRIRLVL
jgi:asparagine synthase (glutamine-hydrolysing)